MNEHIEKRFKQAVSSASGELHEWNKNWTPGCPNFDYEKVLYEKFAELIIQECAKFVSNDRLNDEYGQFVANRIKQHFGVEE